MTWRWVCDSCTGDMESPITLAFHLATELDEDDDEEPEELEHHFCSFGCVAAWSMTQALEG